MLIDTHCHLHMAGYKLDPLEEIELAKKAGVEKIILVGDNIEDSKLAVAMAANDKNLYATVGVHPHNAGKEPDLNPLRELSQQSKVVAIGECGLDYWYQHSSREDQISVLKYQIELALSVDLPLTLHLRGSKDNPGDVFEDFFAIFDDYNNRDKKPRGVVHSFTAGQAELEGVLSRGLFVGLNGIVTFGDAAMQEVIKHVPLRSMLVETDTPFLTPVPKRGTVNAPKYLVLTVEYIAKQLNLNFEEIAQATTSNAEKLFKLEA